MPSSDFFPYLAKDQTTSLIARFESKKFYEEKSIAYITGSYVFEQSRDALKDLKEEHRQTELLYDLPMTDLYNEYAMYGFVDHEGDTIIPIEQDSFLTKVGKNENGYDLFLQNFAAKALEDMQKYLNYAILKGCATNSSLRNKLASSIFLNFKVTKAYSKEISPIKLHLSSANVAGLKFKEFIQSHPDIDSKIEDINIYLEYFIPFLKRYVEYTFINIGSIHRKNHYEHINNTLTFKILSDDLGDYEKNYQKYYMDPAFLLFCNACRKFGFRFDKYNPFILHADLSSPNMKKYYLEEELEDPVDIFEKRFYKAYLIEYNSLIKFINESYNSFIYKNENVKKNLDTLCKAQMNTADFNISFKRSNKEFNASTKNKVMFLIKIYLYFKIFEYRQGIDQNYYKYLIDECYKYYRASNNINMVFRFINEKFNNLAGVKYFDYLNGKYTGVESVGAGFGAVEQPDIIF